MNVFKRHSITLSLWLALSVLATALTAPSLGGYVWLAIRDDITRAHSQTDSTASMVLTTVQRLRSEGAVPSDTQLIMAQRLNVEFIQVLDRNGQPITTFGPNADASPLNPVDPDLLAQASFGIPANQSMRMDDDLFKAAASSPWNVLRGGDFAQEYVFPMQVSPGQQGSLRLIVRYPDLTTDAQKLLARAVVAGFAIIATTVFVMWLLLRQSISQPLRRYSNLASRIALGEQVRMPDVDANELGELGRAVNGMADALQYQATVDSLTGLFNLRHLSSTLESLLKEALRSNQPLSLIVGDLDNLKPINDTYGHQAGDRVLQAVGDTILAWAGNDCVCWRLGGDEFVVALPNTSGVNAETQAASLKRAIDSMTVRIGEDEVSTTISVGVSSHPEDGYTAGELLGYADRRMYQAKASKANGNERKLADSPAA